MADRETLVPLVGCGHCDFSSGTRGMDRCSKCDGTGSQFAVGDRRFANTRDGYEAALEASLSRLNAKVEELERERLKLRTALIGTGRNLGAFLADDVSSDFLTLLPEEARLLKARLARAVEVMRPFTCVVDLPDGHVQWTPPSLPAFQAARAFLSEQENPHG